LVPQALENRSDHGVFAFGITARSDSQSDYGVDFLLDSPDEADDLFGPFHWHFDLYDCRQNFFIQYVLAKGAGFCVGHRRCDRVALFEGDTSRGQPPANLLDLSHPRADTGPPEFDGESNFADIHASRDVIGLDFFRFPALDPGRLMRHSRIRKSAPDDPW